MPIRLQCLAVLTLLALNATAADRVADKGLRFDSPGVIDLARHTQWLRGNALPAIALDAGVVQQILAAPALDQDKATLPFSDYAFGCAADSKNCVAQHERELIAGSGGAVRRDKKHLSVKPTDAPALVFIDWQEPTTKTADGDSETHWYLGTLAKSGFHQVEVQFGHDAPGSFLINAKSGKTAFVHNGSDIATSSPDGLHLLTFNADNPPLMLRVAALDAAGPRLELECTASEENRVMAQFKGWRDATGFDLVLAAPGAKPLPVRVAHGKDGWTPATSTPGAWRSAGIACRAPAGN